MPPHTPSTPLPHPAVPPAAVEHPICTTCGTQFDGHRPRPAVCPICADERQYVGWGGQAWTTHAALAASHRLRIGDDDGLLALTIDGGYAIGQRLLWLPTRSGCILWETTSLVTPEAVAALKARGGVDRIVISHPHFYAAMVEWSDAFGGVPLTLHAADRRWVMRESPALDFWDGDTRSLGPDVTLLRTGGHFDGSTVLHWASGPRGRPLLLTGDSPQVVADRRHVSFMRSYPNLMPMPPADVHAMQQRLAGLDFDDAYGYAWGRNIIGGARAAVDGSFERYLRAVQGVAAP